MHYILRICFKSTFFINIRSSLLIWHRFYAFISDLFYVKLELDEEFGLPPVLFNWRSFFVTTTTTTTTTTNNNNNNCKD